VARFLAAHPDWHLAGFKHPLTGETVTELQLLPQRDGVDGFYLAFAGKKSTGGLPLLKQLKLRLQPATKETLKLNCYGGAC
jgi:hypothetical protein